MKRLITLAIVALTMMVMMTVAASAFAYPESAEGGGTLPTTGCPSCHGIESGTTSPTVAPTRKGPHGGYSTGTNKCEVCHTLHGAASARMLLPEATISGTCNTCHDGTGGGGVYGVIERRTGKQAFGHVIGVATNGAVSVPGGDPNGGSIDRKFSGENGGLTCTDCHDPHDANTVTAFVGDRVRTSSDETTSLATNRLLRNKPTSAETTVAAYGSDWCEACHKGSSRGTMTHPVADSTSTPSADYMHVTKLKGYDTTEVASAPGPLGGNNLGYVVPTGSGGKPICQQCHEDSRSIANDMAKPGEISSQTESFSAPVDGAVDGNPTFQNFPHETVNDSMLIETGDSLCLNCHPQTPSGAVH